MSQNKILIVEDETIIAFEIESRVKKLGYSVLAIVSNGSDAIKISEEKKPDLVLMDIMLHGDMDGIAAADEIRLRFNIPVIFLTAYADKQTLERAKITEPFGYLIKPFEERELQTAIEMALYKHKMDKKLRESERRLSITLKSIGDGVVTTDINGTIEFMNPVAENLTGCSLEKALGKNLTKVVKLVNEDTGKKIENITGLVLAKNSLNGLDGHALLIVKGGRRIPVLNSAAPIKDEHDIVTGVVLILKDNTKHKQAEDIIRRTRDQLTRLMSASPTVIYSAKITSNFGATFVSENVKNQLGYEPKEFLEDANFWADNIHPDDTPRVFSNIGNLFKNGRHSQVYRFQHKDGSYRWLHDEMVLLKDEYGNPAEIAGSWRDITREKIAEENLRKSEEKYRLIFDNNPHPMWVYDLETLSFLAVNNVAVHNYGYSKEDFYSMTIKDIRPVEDVPRLLDTISNINGIERSGIWRHRLKNGNIIDVEITSHSIIFEGENCRLVLANNVTKRILAEKALKISEEKFRGIAERSFDLIFMLNCDGNFIYVSPSIIQIMGYTVSEVTGKSLKEFVTNSSFRDVLHALQKVLTGKFINKLQLKVIRKDGRTSYLELNLSPVYKGDEITGLQGVGRDVTAREIAEDKLKRSNRALKTISEVNELLIRAGDERKLLDESCRIIIDAGGYLLVWVGFKKNDKAKSVKVISSHGSDEGYLKTIKISWADNKWGQGPTGKAIRNGQVVIAKDIIRSSFFKPWRDEAVKRGFSSSIAIPLMQGSNEAFGALNIYSKEVNAFDAEEVKLLSELADDLAYGIITLRTRNEHKLFEKALMESEEKLRNLYNNSPIGIYRTTPEGKILLVNPALLQMLGYSSLDKLIKRNLEDPEFIGRGYDRKEFKELVDKEGGLKGYESKWIKENGETIFVRENAKAVRDSFGNILYYDGTVEDITERKLAEEAIIKSESQFRLIWENSGDGMRLTDKNGTVVLVNKAFCKMVNMAKEDIEGKLMSVAYEPKQREHILKIFKEKFNEHGSLEHFEKELILWNGKKIWFEVTESFLQIEGHEPLLLNIFRDITERRKIENELKKSRENLEEIVEERTLQLRQSEEKFRALAENSNDAIMRFTRGLKHLYVNPVVLEQTGIHASEFIGKTHRELNFPEYLIEIWETALNKVFNSKKKNRIEFQLPNGVWIDWLLIPEFNKSSEVESVITSGRDITALKEMEKEIKNALKKEKELNELKSRFVSIVSHEFRTPLATILSSAELVETYGYKWTEEKKSTHFQKIRRSVDNLTALLNDVSSLNKADIEKARMDLRKVEVVGFIKDIVDEIKFSSKEVPNISLNAYKTKIIMHLNEKLFRQIVSNLLTNAVKYTPLDKNVHVNIKEEVNYIKLEIKDEGIGIPEEDRKNLFEPFMRGKNIGKINGSGLGLSITKRAVEALNGEIIFNSNEGLGTTFCVKLPIYSEEKWL